MLKLFKSIVAFVASFSLFGLGALAKPADADVLAPVQADKKESVSTTSWTAPSNGIGFTEVAWGAGDISACPTTPTAYSLKGGVDCIRYLTISGKPRVQINGSFLTTLLNSLSSYSYVCFASLSYSEEPSTYPVNFVMKSGTNLSGTTIPSETQNASIALSEYQGIDDGVFVGKAYYLPVSYLNQLTGVYVTSTTSTFGNLKGMTVCGYNVSGTQLKNGGTQEVYVDVDKPLSITELLAQVKAVDLFGAEVTVTCSNQVVYTPATLGTYSLNLSATDSYGQTATATLEVYVVDYVGPTIVLASGKSLTFHVGHDTLKAADVASYFTVADNGTAHGGTIKSIVYKWDGTVYSADKTFAKADLGTHTLEVVATDSSNNATTKDFTVSVSDIDKPVIERRDGGNVTDTIAIGLSKTFALLKDDFLALFKATDVCDGDVSSSLSVVGDFAITHTGSYSITIKAVDSSSNAVTAVVPIVVSADIPPVFILGSALVLTDTRTKLSTTQISTIVVNGIFAGRKVISINSIDPGNYIGNETVAGDYPVTYDVNLASVEAKGRKMAVSEDVTGTFILRNVQAKDSATDDTASKPWYQPIVDFFCKTLPDFFQRLGNWFKVAFTKNKWNVWLNNEEYKAAFD